MTLRADLKIICDLVEPGAKVLDIGCGEGELLKALKTERNSQARGVELDPVKVAITHQDDHVGHRIAIHGKVKLVEIDGFHREIKDMVVVGNYGL